MTGTKDHHRYGKCHSPIKNHIVQDFIMPNCRTSLHLNKQSLIAGPIFFCLRVLCHATVSKIKSLLLWIVVEILKSKQLDLSRLKQTKYLFNG